MTMPRACVSAAAVTAVLLAGCAAPQDKTDQTSTPVASSAATSSSAVVNAPSAPSGTTGPAGLTGWPVPAGDGTVTPDTIAAALLTESEVVKIIGADSIGDKEKITKPYKAEKSDDASCDVVQGQTVESIGTSFKAFGGVGMAAVNEDQKYVGSVFQTVAGYADKDAAQQQFKTALEAVQKCDGKKLTLTIKGKDYPVSVTVYPATETSVVWSYRYDKSGLRCYTSMEGIGTGLVQAQICASGNTRSLAEQISEQIVDRMKLAG